jgi:hypothetical protein
MRHGLVLKKEKKCGHMKVHEKKMCGHILVHSRAKKKLALPSNKGWRKNHYCGVIIILFLHTCTP